MAWLRTAVGFLLPSITAVFAGVFVTGFLEALFAGLGFLPSLASTGYLSILAIPAVLLVTVALRLLFHAWQPQRLAAELADETTSGLPRIAAWLLYALVAAGVLGVLSFIALGALLYSTDAKNVLAMASMLVMVTLAALVAALSRPAVRLFTLLLSRLDAAFYRRFQRSLFPPQLLLPGSLAFTFLSGVVFWYLWLRPRIGFLDVSFVWFSIAGAVVVALVHYGWTLTDERPRARWLSLAVTAAFTVTTLASSIHSRYETPSKTVDIWGNTLLAGHAVDLLYDIDDLRNQLELDALRPEELVGAEHPNIILITIDTVRADRTPMYKGPANMPNLNRFSRRGSIVEWAFSPANVTRRSMPTMMTGLSPNRVKGRVVGWALKLDPRHRVLGERLNAVGYEGAGFFCCGSLFDPERKLGFTRGLDTIEIIRKGDKLSERALAWIQQREKRPNETRPYFLWLHLLEPHDWANVYHKERRAGQWAEGYDKSLAVTDQALGPLFAELGKPQYRLNTTVIVTSDHGESLGEFDYVNHGASLYNFETRVPLVVVGPGIKPQRIHKPIGLVDLTPTILDLAGYQPPQMPEMDGVSVAAELRGRAPTTIESGEAYAVTVKDRSMDRNMVALVAGRYKLIDLDDGKGTMLFDLLSDPTEKNDLAKTQPDTLRSLQERLAKRRSIDRISPFE